ncbi:MAG: SCO family protein [Opitutales bacterium]
MSSAAQSPYQAQPPEVTFEQRLGEQLPAGLSLRDASGRRLTLGDYLGDQPLLLGMGYNECPMLCGSQLQGMMQVVGATDLRPGKDFMLLFVSIDADEPQAVTQEAQADFRRAMKTDGAGVAFLTGSQPSVDTLAGKIGFGYEYVPGIDQYAHPAGWVVVTPDGTVSSYLLGVRYEPDELTAGVATAAEAEVGSEKPSLLLRCLRYNPLNGHYGTAVDLALKAGALLTIVGIGTFTWRLERRRKR